VSIRAEGVANLAVKSWTKPFMMINIYPANIVIHGLGAVFWTVAGYLAKDKAIITNFSLQLPLFAVGLINAFAVN